MLLTIPAIIRALSELDAHLFNSVGLAPNVSLVLHANW